MIPSFVRLFASVLSALVLLDVDSQAVGVATVDLSGATFGSGRDVHLTSGTTYLPAATLYDYAISGTIRGTGLLSAIIPSGTRLSQLLEQLQPGSSSVLNGTQLNPGGTLPISIVNRTFSGAIPIAVGVNATAKMTIVGRVSGIGQIRFHVVNVEFSIPGIADVGTVVLEPGSKVTVSVQPVIEFRSAAVTVSEDVGTLLVRVRRKVNTETAVSVVYSSAPATATANDFEPLAGVLVFAPGEVVKIFPVTIKFRLGTQGSRIFRLRLSNAVGANIGLIQRETVTITDKR